MLVLFVPKIISLCNATFYIILVRLHARIDKITRAEILVCFLISLVSYSYAYWWRTNKQTLSIIQIPLFFSFAYASSHASVSQATIINNSQIIPSQFTFITELIRF